MSAWRILDYSFFFPQKTTKALCSRFGCCSLGICNNNRPLEKWVIEWKFTWWLWRHEILLQKWDLSERWCGNRTVHVVTSKRESTTKLYSSVSAAGQFWGSLITRIPHRDRSEDSWQEKLIPFYNTHLMQLNEFGGCLGPHPTCTQEFSSCYVVRGLF